MAKNNKNGFRDKGLPLLGGKRDTEKSADEVGLSMSDYIRSIIFSDKKLILLTEGSEIAKLLFLIRTDLEHFRKCESFPQEAVKPLTDSLNDVSTSLFALSGEIIGYSF